MGSSKVQIDARLALRSLASTRSRKAVYAPCEALHYRYEGRQFFHLDFSTFASLFAALTRQQLSTVAKAPDVIEAASQSRLALDDSWSRLYREGRKSKPIWAALSLVEAAHHALAEALGAREPPPLEVIDTCDNHVRWLKNTLCRPDPRLTEPTRSAVQSAHGAPGDRSQSTKRGLDDAGGMGDGQCHKKRVDSVQIERDNPGRDTLGAALLQHKRDSSTMAGADAMAGSVVGYPSPSLGSAAILQTGKFATSRTVEPSIDLSSSRPFDDGLNSRVAGNMASNWINNSISQPISQPREPHVLASSTTTKPEDPPEGNTILERGPSPTQHGSLRLANPQNIDGYAIWDNDNDVLGDVDTSSLFQ